MKKLFIILLLLWAGVAYGASTTLSGTGSTGLSATGSTGFVASGGCDCTGDVIFCWEITADDLTITNSGGCAAGSGDTTGTVNSAADIVANPDGDDYALSIPTTYDYVAFDVSSNDIFDPSTGTLQFDIYMHTWVSGRHIIYMYGLAGEDELAFGTSFDEGNYRLTSEGANAGAVVIDSTETVTFNEWVTVTVKWRTGVTDPSLSMTVEATTDTTNTDLTAWDNAATAINFGNKAGSSGGNVVYLKNITIYDSWQ